MGPRSSSAPAPPTSGVRNMKVTWSQPTNPTPPDTVGRKKCGCVATEAYYLLQTTDPDLSSQPTAAWCCPSFCLHLEPPSLFSSLPYYPNTILDSDQSITLPLSPSPSPSRGSNNTSSHLTINSIQRTVLLDFPLGHLETQVYPRVDLPPDLLCASWSAAR